jgi:hypothetical protein
MTAARFCQTCGAPLTPGHRFCETCGQPVVAGGAGIPRLPAVPPHGYRPALARSNVGVAVLVFLLILAIGGGAIWWFLWPKSLTPTGPSVTPSSPFSYSPTPSPSASSPSFSPSPTTPSPSPSPTATPSSPFSYSPTPSPSASTPSFSPSPTPSFSPSPTPSPSLSPSATPSSTPTPTETPTLPTPSTSPAVVVGELQAQSFVLQFLDALKNGSLSTAGLMTTEHFKSLEPFFFSVPADFYASLEFEITRTEKVGDTVWVYTRETMTGSTGQYQYRVIAGPDTLLIDEVQPTE